LIKKNPDALIAKFTKANMNLSGIPNFSGPDSETKRINWYRTHWFDNIDMADPRFLRTKLQFDRVDYFINKLTIQQPDSIINAIDRVLGLVRPATETFKFYTTHFLNTYAKSTIVGMDAVYVHMAKTYYATGQTPWIENESLQKIVENANRIEPLLIGKKAPDIMLPNFEAKTVRLHEQKSPYTIIYFWKPTDDKAQLQAMVKAYNENKAKGLFVYAVCMSNDAEVCKQSILVNGMDAFTHVYDADNKGVYSLLYDIKTTPQLYVLDVSKIIRSKKIKAEQLKDVFAAMGWNANP
jgi:peroxiredoxin